MQKKFQGGCGGHMHIAMRGTDCKDVLLLVFSLEHSMCRDKWKSAEAADEGLISASAASKTRQNKGW
jgi:hypothetical protein